MTVYLFGRLNGGYTQYPDDGTSGVLGSLYPLARATAQVIIRRDGNFMYYCYIRKLQDDRYVGMCVLLNGTYIWECKKLFSLFETRIDEMCEKGIFIRYDEEGNICSVVSHFHEESEEATFVAERIRQAFSPLLKWENPLPPVDFSVERDSKMLFSEAESNADIVKASCKFGYTCIYKQTDYDTIRMNSYKSVLQGITAENNELKKQNKELQKANEAIKRQKKQFKNVVVLLLLVIGCGVGIYFLYDNLNATQGELSQANKEKNERDSVIVGLRDSISQLTTRNEELNGMYEEAVSEHEDYVNTVTSFQPFLLKKTSFDFSSGDLTIPYYGLKEGDCDIIVRVIFPDNSTKSYERTVSVSKGNNNASVYISSYFDRDKWHTFEILYNDKVIGGGRH